MPLTVILPAYSTRPDLPNQPKSFVIEMSQDLVDRIKELLQLVVDHGVLSVTENLDSGDFSLMSLEKNREKVFSMDISNIKEQKVASNHCLISVCAGFVQFQAFSENAHLKSLDALNETCLYLTDGIHLEDFFRSHDSGVLTTVGG